MYLIKSKLSKKLKNDIEIILGQGVICKVMHQNSQNIVSIKNSGTALHT